MTLKSRIQAGYSGDYTGLENGFNRLNNYIFGLQKGCYTLLGGNSGAYKTSLCDFIVLNAIEDAQKKGIKLNVFYNSFEIDKLSKQCNWLSQLIHYKHNLIIPPEKIKGFGGSTLTDAEKQIIDIEIPFIEEIFNRIKFSFAPTNPTGIYNELWKFGESLGTFERNETYKYLDKEGNTVEGVKLGKFQPNDPKEMTLVITDHMALLKKERGFHTKEVIDKYSEYCVELRNHFGYSFINIQQFNSGLSNIDRQRFKGVDLSPAQNDFKDSTSPYADADIVLGSFVPYKVDLDTYMDYDLLKLKQSFVAFKVIKNRLSQDNVTIGLYANPKAGIFKELPFPNKINYDDYKI